MNFTIENALVCDDVRREVTQKDILIGVYNDTINAGLIPGTINLCFWMKILPREAGKLVIELKVDLPGAIQPIQIGLSVEVITANQMFSAQTPQIGYSISQPGDIKLSARLVGTKKWRPVTKITVRHDPSVVVFPPTVYSPPS